MNLRSIAAPVSLAFVTALDTAACTSGSTEAEDGTEQGVGAEGEPHSHVASHGMNLFGREHFYVSHLPTFGTPHNYQAIVEVKVVSGVPATQTSFSDKLYTIRPSPFSLYDMAHGTLAEFTGTIFNGNFESGGRPLYNNVKFAITKVIDGTPLAPSTPQSQTLDYIAVGTPTDAYLVHVLKNPRDFDSIIGLKPTTAFDPVALAGGTKVTVEGRPNSIQGRVLGNTTVRLLQRPATFTPTGVPEGEPVTGVPGLPTDSPDSGVVTTDAGVPSDAGATDGGTPQDPNVTAFGEYTCLLGPDYFQRCR